MAGPQYLVDDRIFCDTTLQTFATGCGLLTVSVAANSLAAREPTAFIRLYHLEGVPRSGRVLEIES